METPESLTETGNRDNGGVGQVRELLQIRDLRNLLLSRLISNIGNGITPVALSFGVLDLDGARASSLSIVNGAHMVALVLFMLVGGVVADRWGRCRTVGLTDIVGSIVVAGSAVLLITGAATVALLAVLAFLLGALHALWQPAFRGIMPQIIQPSQLQAANAMNGVVANLAYVIGAALAGVLVATVGAGWAIAIDAATFLVAGVLVWNLRHLDDRHLDDVVSRSSVEERSTTVLRELRDGWQEFVSRRWMVVTVASLSVFFLAFEAFLGVVGPVQLKEELDGARDMGVMMAGWGVGGFFGMIAALRLRPSRPMRAAWAVMPIHALWMFAVAVPLPVGWLFGAAVLSGVAIDLTFTWWGTVLQTHVPAESLSRVSSYDALGVALFGPVGLAICGPLVDAHGASTVAVAIGVVAILSGITPLMFRDVRAVERRDV